ncbi:MAG: asparagine synthase (glutamine-hydrolyzing) [Bacteroidota bacterium]
MCGICGIVHYDRQQSVKAATLSSMAQSIVHRGPDDEGYHLQGRVGLGFRRLSIIDLDTGHQPLSNEDGTIWIAFNGEVYNFGSLRQQLLARGHRFKTKSDTETIVHLYEEYGKDCVQHLRGMFAFAIWDERRQQLFCARDRFGIKPFFYHLSKDGIAFASEIKALLRLPNVSREMDPVALDSYFAYKYITDDRSIYQSIKKLPPAHTLQLDLSGSQPQLRIDRYWDIAYQPDHQTDEREWCERLKAELRTAIQLRMISDVPLGAFLSGGIDSSSVVGIMAGLSANPVKTFSIGFAEPQYNELPFARMVANRYGTDHHEKIIEPESVSLLPTLAAGYDEPFADSSAIPTYYVSQFARQHVTVVLSGDGGDELFAGYSSYAKLAKINRYNFVPDAIRPHLWGTLNNMLPDSFYGKGLSYYLAQPKAQLSARLATLWQQPERRQLYRPDFLESLNMVFAEQHKEQLLRQSNAEDAIFKAQELDMRTYMVDDILTKVDRASMLNSLEARVPLLDHKVAELSFKIPTALKLRGDCQKYIFKKAMAAYLPHEVLHHHKQGFTVPMKMWFRDSLQDYVQDRLGSRNNVLSDYLKMDKVHKVVQAHRKGMRDLNEKIWSLLFLDAWLQQYES